VVCREEKPRAEFPENVGKKAKQWRVCNSCPRLKPGVSLARRNPSKVPPAPEGFDTPNGWMPYEEYRRKMDAFGETEFVVINDAAKRWREAQIPNDDDFESGDIFEEAV
jgi:hypothetical protein